MIEERGGLGQSFETALGTERFEALVSEGQRLTLEEALDVLEDGPASDRHVEDPSVMRRAGPR